VVDKDWYAVLKMAADAPTADIAGAVEKLSRQAASMANTAPERSQQLRETVRAMKRDLLSGDEARERYNGQRRPASHVAGASPREPYPPPVTTTRRPGPAVGPSPGNEDAKKRPSRFMQFLQSGWTCPECGEGALPGDKFCPRCGADIPSPTVAELGSGTARSLSCRNCGTPATTGSRFCTGCGASLG
jgi:Double zinc ribbon